MADRLPDVLDDDVLVDEELTPQQGELLLVDRPIPTPETESPSASPPGSFHPPALPDRRTIARNIQRLPAYISEVRHALMAVNSGPEAAVCRDAALFLEPLAKIAKSRNLEIEVRELVVLAEFAFVDLFPRNPGGRGKRTSQRHLAGFTKSQVDNLCSRYRGLPFSELKALLDNARRDGKPVRIAEIVKAAKAARSGISAPGDSDSAAKAESSAGCTFCTSPASSESSPKQSIQIVVRQPWAAAASAAGDSIEEWVIRALDHAAMRP